VMGIALSSWGGGMVGCGGVDRAWQG
jgi:hypothetical protein